MSSAGTSSSYSFRHSQGPHHDDDQSLGNEVAKDKGEGKEDKPSSEIKDVAKTQNNAVKAREAKAEGVPSSQPSKKEITLPSVKTRSRCRSHQIFGAIRFESHPFLSLDSRTSCN